MPTAFSPPAVVALLAASLLAGCGGGGTVVGRDFVPDRAILEGSVLTLRQGDDFFADRQIKVFLFDDEATLGDRSWHVDGETSGVPHVHLSWRDTDAGAPDMDVVAGGYRMDLELGWPTREGIPVSIDLAIEGEEPTRIEHEIIAEVRNPEAVTIRSTSVGGGRRAAVVSSSDDFGATSREGLGAAMDEAMLEMGRLIEEAAAAMRGR